MRRWCALVLLMSLLTAVGGVRPAEAAEEDFDAFFEQAAIFPVDFSSRVFIKGELYFLNGPVEMKEGVLYVSSTLLGYLLGDDYYVLDTGARENGEISLLPSEPGQMSWSYTEGDPLAFVAWVGEKRCMVYDEVKTLQHAPYRLTLDNGTPYAMLPLREVCQALGVYCDYNDGLIVLAKSAPNEALMGQRETLGLIKEQLSQPFVGDNSHYFQQTQGGILISVGEKMVPVAGYDHFEVYQAQNSKGQEAPYDEDTPERTTAIALTDLVTHKSQIIAQLPNVKVGYADQSKDWYHFYSHPQGQRVTDGYLIWAFHFGGNAQSSCTYLFYVSVDGRVVELSNTDTGNYFYDEEALYFCQQYIHTPMGGQPGLLYRFRWSDAAPERIGVQNMDYRQMVRINDQQVIVAASAADAPEKIHLYQLDLASGEQKLLTKEPVSVMKMNDETFAYFQIIDGQIIYYSDAEQKLSMLSPSGGESQLMTEQLLGERMQSAAGGLYFVGQDGHLYQLNVHEQKVIDLSGCKIKQYVADEGRVFYLTSGYQAGLYLLENGQTQKLLSQQLENLMLDQDGLLAVQPKDACGYYYIYRQGELQKVTL